MRDFHYKVDDQGHLFRVSAGRGVSPIPIGRIHVNSISLTWMGSPRPVARDLVRIACAVHQVDRLCPRLSRKEDASAASWYRHIRLELGVEQPSIWSAHVKELEALLKWLTDDHWELTFRLLATLPLQQSDLCIQRDEGAAEVALFSGGLDSTAGALVRAREQNRPVYLLSSVGTSVRNNFLRSALAPLREAGLRYRWIAFHHQLRQSLGHISLDTTQRTRGFLFWCIGASVADTLKLSVVSTYECGVGAINLPMNTSQVGAHNTHSMHPMTLLRLERIFQDVLETSLRLEAPFLLLTKGELCRRAGRDIISLAQASNSCDETERSKSDLRDHCGICTSCLLRRSALNAALGKDVTRYRSRETRRCGQYQVDAFKAQAQHFLSFLTYENLYTYSTGEIEAVVDYLVSRQSPKLSRQEAEQQLLSLFHRHAREVLRFYEQERPRSLPRPSRKRTLREPLHAPLFSANW